jgi:uncharacterized membrane protein YidH (DUF202 family)
MWVWMIIQGVIGGAVLVWFALQDWPTHVVASLLALPFPAIFIFGGLMLRHRDRMLKPQQQAYLEANESARRELNRARLIKWGAMAAVLVVVVIIARSMPRNYEGSSILVWIVGSILIAAIALPMLYGSLVRYRIEDAAARQHSGKPPLTPAEKRTRTIWFVGALALLVGIVAFDQFVDSPVSALTVLVYGVLIFAGVAFVCRKRNPPRDP